MRRTPLALLVAAAFPLAGCGEKSPDPIIERDARAITSPGTNQAYETGGADGSGADGVLGSEKAEPRGGVGAGPDKSGERKR